MAFTQKRCIISNNHKSTFLIQSNFTSKNCFWKLFRANIRYFQNLTISKNCKKKQKVRHSIPTSHKLALLVQKRHIKNDKSKWGNCLSNQVEDIIFSVNQVFQYSLSEPKTIIWRHVWRTQWFKIDKVSSLKKTIFFLRKSTELFICKISNWRKKL